MGVDQVLLNRQRLGERLLGLGQCAGIALRHAQIVVAHRQVAAVSGHQRSGRDQPLLNGDRVLKATLGIRPARQARVDRAEVVVAQRQIALIVALPGMLLHQSQLQRQGLFDPAPGDGRLGIRQNSELRLL